MENPASWKAIHFAVDKVIKENQEPSFLSYELMQKLRPTYIPSSLEDSAVIEALDQAIWDHDEAKTNGKYGMSLPMRLSRTIERLRGK